jgi:spore coat-associated protein N
MKKSALSKSSTKVLASVVLVAGAASVAGLGTFGAFTSTTSASEAVSTSKVVLGLTQHSALGTTVAATNMVPGDTVQRAVVLTRSSDTEAFGSVKLTTAGGTANALTTDATDGLQLAVDQCSTGWTKAATTNALTCGGTTTSIISARHVVGTNLDLGAATTTLNSSAAAANLRLTLSLPTTADNTFQGLANTVAFTFDATQRAAQAK